MSQSNSHWRFGSGSNRGFTSTRCNNDFSRSGYNKAPAPIDGEQPYNPHQFSPSNDHTAHYWRSSVPRPSHSPTASVTTPPRPRGPRTPPGPPPEERSTVGSYQLATFKERHYDNWNEYNDQTHQGNRRFQPKNHHQNWRTQRPYYKYQSNRNNWKRRDAYSQPSNHHHWKPAEHGYNGDERAPSPNTTKEKDASGLNTVVQSYLLQVLTGQPPPSSLPQDPHSVRTPPPLPPTPVRIVTPPPPPPSDVEENWDTPSEASNDGTTFPCSNQSQQENPFENAKPADSPVSSAGSGLVIDIPNMEDMQDSTIDNLPNQVDSILKFATTADVLHSNSNEGISNVVPSEDTNAFGCNDNSFKIKLPSRKEIIAAEQERTAAEQPVEQPVAKTSPKRKKPTNKSTSKFWSLELAERALNVEQELAKEDQNENVLILRFPDPPLNSEIIKDFNADIKSVYFQQNSAPRYCFVHLQKDANVETTIEALSKVPFGNGFVKAELRNVSNATKPSCNVKAENIDPFTLYVGNLSPTIPCSVLKEHFPGSKRIDIGFAQRMKRTRYAFVHYQKVDDAIEAYRRMLRSEIYGRSLIIRFKRLGAVFKCEEDSHGRSETNDYDEDHGDTCSMLSTSTMPSEIVDELVPIPTECERNDCDISMESDGQLVLNRSDKVQENVEKLNQDYQSVTESHITVSSQLSSTAAVSQIVANNVEASNDVMKSATVGKVSPNIDKPNDLPSTTEADDFSYDMRACEDAVLTDRLEERVIVETTKQLEEHAITQPTGQIISTPEDQLLDDDGIENENENTNAVQILQPDHVQDNVNVMDIHCTTDTIISMDNHRGSTETIIAETRDSAGITETPERILYSVPMSNGCLPNINDDIDIKSELNDNLDISSQSNRRGTTDSVDTLRLLSNNSYNNTEEYPKIDTSKCGLEDILAPPSYTTTTFHANTTLEVKNELLETSLTDADSGLSMLEQALQPDGIKSTTILQDFGINTFFEDDNSRASSQQSHSDKDIVIVIDNPEDDDLVPANSLLKQNNRQATNETIRAATRDRKTPLPLEIKEEFTRGNINANGRNQSQRNRKESQSTQVMGTTNTSNYRIPKIESSANIIASPDMKPPMPDDDDVVPQNCALLLRHRPTEIYDLTLDDDPIMTIKREAETEDLFALPKGSDRKRKRTKENTDNVKNGRNNVTFTNKLTSDLLIPRKATRDQQYEGDEDVIVISEDLNQSKGFQDKHEKTQMTTTIEKSFYDRHKRPAKHRDTLDRLFALLNSDSDEES